MPTWSEIEFLDNIEPFSLCPGPFNSVPTLVLPSEVGAHRQGEREAESLKGDIEGDTLGELGSLARREGVGCQDRQTLT